MCFSLFWAFDENLRYSFTIGASLGRDRKTLPRIEGKSRWRRTEVFQIQPKWAKLPGQGGSPA
jgi:hypothetical protein